MLRFFVILMALTISTSAYAQNRVYDGCIGNCDGVLNDDEYYQSYLGIKPNVEIRSLNMGVFNQLFANSKILHSDFITNNKAGYVIHRYNLLLEAKTGKKEIVYGKCELRFTQFSDLFQRGECQLYEGENKVGIAALLKENFSE